MGEAVRSAASPSYSREATQRLAFVPPSRPTSITSAIGMDHKLSDACYLGTSFLTIACIIHRQDRVRSCLADKQESMGGEIEKTRGLRRRQRAKEEVPRAPRPARARRPHQWL